MQQQDNDVHKDASHEQPHVEDAVHVGYAVDDTLHAAHATEHAVDVLPHEQQQQQQLPLMDENRHVVHVVHIVHVGDAVHDDRGRNAGVHGGVHGEVVHWDGMHEGVVDGRVGGVGVDGGGGVDLWVLLMEGNRNVYII